MGEGRGPAVAPAACGSLSLIRSLLPLGCVFSPFGGTEMPGKATCRVTDLSPAPAPPHRRRPDPSPPPPTPAVLPREPAYCRVRSRIHSPGQDQDRRFPGAFSTQGHEPPSGSHRAARGVPWAGYGLLSRTLRAARADKPEAQPWACPPRARVSLRPGARAQVSPDTQGRCTLDVFGFRRVQRGPLAGLHGWCPWHCGVAFAWWGKLRRGLLPQRSCGVSRALGHAWTLLSPIRVP